MHFTITTGAGDSIEIHTEKQASSSRIDIRQSGGATIGSSMQTNVLVHGIYSVYITLILSYFSYLTKVRFQGNNNYSIYNNIYFFYFCNNALIRKAINLN